MKSKMLLAAFFAALAVASPAMGQAHDDDDDNGRGFGQRLFRSDIVRVADISASPALGPSFGPNGDDPLQRGEISVRRRRQVQVNIKGAMADATYNLFFCSFGFPPPCLGMGSFDTNSLGNAREDFDFSHAGTGWTGVFVITRDAPGPTNEFVSGFRFPSDAAVAAVQAGLATRIEGVIATVGANSFTLAGLPQLLFVVGPDTEFRDLAGFLALQPGQRVEVTSTTITSGVLSVLEVELENRNQDEDQDRGRGRGRGGDDDDNDDDRGGGRGRG